MAKKDDGVRILVMARRRTGGRDETLGKHHGEIRPIRFRVLDLLSHHHRRRRRRRRRRLHRHDLVPHLLVTGDRSVQEERGRVLDVEHLTVPIGDVGAGDLEGLGLIM